MNYNTAFVKPERWLVKSRVYRTQFREGLIKFHSNSVKYVLMQIFLASVQWFRIKVSKQGVTQQKGLFVHKDMQSTDLYEICINAWTAGKCPMFAWITNKFLNRNIILDLDTSWLDRDGTWSSIYLNFPTYPPPTHLKLRLFVYNSKAWIPPPPSRFTIITPPAVGEAEF